MFSRHAQIRMQQRGVPYAAVEILFAVGREEHTGAGFRIIYLDSHARKEARGLFRNAGVGDNCLDAYLVIGPMGNVVTVGHRYSSIKDH